jgi:site-specific DNA recombinase
MHALPKIHQYSESAKVVLAAEQRRCRVRMMKVAKLVCLDPYIVTAIVEGRQPLNLSPSKLLAADLPLAWADQRRVLGFS